ncbi:MAG TPA: VWA domain-containing protein [Vicinamibacterales bacterium]|jgi:VWFA-related protein|nr:VWA domain-containing protein [Vicinamibacterales bacterium]
MKMRTSFAAAVFTLLLAGAPAGQQPAPPQPPAGGQPPLTFKVDVNYVEIDAQVTDAQGNFVRNLTKDDFQIVENGKPQTLTVFSTVDIPVEHVDPPLFAKTAIPPDVSTNARPFEGRLFVIVVDDLHTAPSRTARVRAAARLFISRYVGANDLVAVINTSGFSSGVQDFTSNRTLALRAVDTAIGQKADSATTAALDDYYRNNSGGIAGDSTAAADSNELERYTKARNALSTMKALATYLDGIHGRRKAVVFFSEGIDYDTTNPFAGKYATEVQDAMQQTIAAATRGNVSIYSVDPRGVTSGTEDLIEIQSFPQDNSISSTQLMEEMRVQHDNLRVLSDQTGGFAVLNQNDFTNAFGRILDDNSSYYVLGYYPTNENRDGKFRSVQIKVLKPGLRVRARKGYYAPKGKAAAAKPTEGKGSPELREAMDSPVGVSGLTVHAFAAAFRGAAPKDAVAIALEIDGTRLPFKQSPEGLFTDDLEISMYAADQKGKIQDGAQDVLNLRLKPATHEVVSKGSFRVVRKLQIPPGKYSVRIGARESNSGLLGTVFFDFEAPDFSKAPLTMSGIVITSASGTRVPTASGDPSGNEFKDVLPGPPTAMREFPSNDQLAMFAEVYDNLPKTPHRVAITASVLADDGKVVFSRADERSSDELKGSAGGYGYTGNIPLSGLGPGRYVLRVEAKSLVGKGDSVSREVEFRVR